MLRHLKRFHSYSDPKETLHFSSHKWWYPSNPLHTISDLRMTYILSRLNLSTLKGLKILDVGCGGGIMSERFAELGADVTGVDPTPNAIKVAQSHLTPKLVNKVKYVQGEVTDIEETFDIVLCSEVIEHVNRQEEFLGEVAKRVKIGGELFLSTMNKTLESWIFGILISEYVLRVIEPGTHSWEKLVKPETLERYCVENFLDVQDTQGWLFDPFRVKAFLANYSQIGYLMHCRKNK